MGSVSVRKLFDLPSNAPYSQIAWFDAAFWIGGEPGKGGRLVRARPHVGDPEWSFDRPRLPGVLGSHVGITAMVSGSTNTGEFLALGLGYTEPGSPPLQYNMAYTNTPGFINNWRTARIERKNSDESEAPSIRAITHQRIANNLDKGILYIGFHSSSIVRTDDVGESYDFVAGSGELQMTYPQVLLAHGSRLWIGQEAPLDCAWGAWADISHGMNTTIPFQLHKTTGGLDWENRRPNCIFPSPVDGNVVYFGLEGAVVVMDASKPDVVGSWLACWNCCDRSEATYPYIQGIFVNPRYPTHVICGGFDKPNDAAPFALFEVQDGAISPFSLPDLPIGELGYVSNILTLPDPSRCVVLVSPMWGNIDPSSVYELSWQA